MLDRAAQIPLTLQVSLQAILLMDVPVARTATDSGPLATAAATSDAHNGELRRPHSAALWARKDAEQACGAVAALAAAAWTDACFAGRSGSADAARNASGGAVADSLEAGSEA